MFLSGYRCLAIGFKLPRTNILNIIYSVHMGLKILSFLTDFPQIHMYFNVKSASFQYSFIRNEAPNKKIIQILNICYIAFAD